MHTGRTDAADLFFIYQQAYAGVLRFVKLKHCPVGWVGTHSVILAIAHDHTLIQSIISCISGRNSFQFCRNKIGFFYIIFLF